MPWLSAPLPRWPSAAGNTGKCPTGIAIQDPELRRLLDVSEAAGRLENFLRVSDEEIAAFARLTGNNGAHGFAASDLCTAGSEISDHTAIQSIFEAFYLRQPRYSKGKRQFLRFRPDFLRAFPIESSIGDRKRGNGRLPSSWGSGNARRCGL
jgi:hypothetical protein